MLWAAYNKLCQIVWCTKNCLISPVLTYCHRSGAAVLSILNTIILRLCPIARALQLRKIMMKSSLSLLALVSTLRSFALDMCSHTGFVHASYSCTGRACRSVQKQQQHATMNQLWRRQCNCAETGLKWWCLLLINTDHNDQCSNMLCHQDLCGTCEIHPINTLIVHYAIMPWLCVLLLSSAAC